jgi:hypothetical protein
MTMVGVVEMKGWLKLSPLIDGPHTTRDGLKLESGDALAIGSSSPEQVGQTLVGVRKGQFNDKARASIQSI